MAEFEQMTLPELTIRTKAWKLREVDKDYRNHAQAYLNFAAQATRPSGKNKVKPVYSRFEKFFDYEKAVKAAKGEIKKPDSRFIELSRYLKQQQEQNDG